MEKKFDPLSQVKKLESLINRNAIEEIIDMFADDVDFELVGLNHIVGKEKLRTVFEYDEGVNNELEFFECTSEENTVNCRMTERNDRLRALGLSDDQLKERILKRARVWLDDGLMFGTGGEGFQRINLACPRSTLERALEAMVGALIGWRTRARPGPDRVGVLRTKCRLWPPLRRSCKPRRPRYSCRSCRR